MGIFFEHFEKMGILFILTIIVRLWKIGFRLSPSFQEKIIFALFFEIFLGNGIFFNFFRFGKKILKNVSEMVSGHISGPSIICGKKTYPHNYNLLQSGDFCATFFWEFKTI